MSPKPWDARCTTGAEHPASAAGMPTAHRGVKHQGQVQEDQLGRSQRHVMHHHRLLYAEHWEVGHQPPRSIQPRHPAVGRPLQLVAEPKQLLRSREGKDWRKQGEEWASRPLQLRCVQASVEVCQRAGISSLCTPQRGCLAAGALAALQQAFWPTTAAAAATSLCNSKRRRSSSSSSALSIPTAASLTFVTGSSLGCAVKGWASRPPNVRRPSVRMGPLPSRRRIA